MSTYQPPFSITNSIITLIAEISEQLGRITIQQPESAAPHLRRENRIRSIHSSLAIEQNTLSLEQVTAIINGKRVLGNPNEIREVQNAYEAYELMITLDPLSVSDLLKAHGRMMQGLVPENGRFRSSGVGIFNGNALVHMAPPAPLVPQEINDLFDWYRASSMHPLIKSAVFHYEFEFIRPFADGNGRMGRMWHSLLLAQWKPLFLWLPVEELIRARQQEYYQTLREADKTSDSTGFIELMLQIIQDALREIEQTQTTDQDSDQDSDPVARLLLCLGEDTCSAAELMQRLHLSHRGTFRKNYLNPALEQGLIERTVPDKPNSKLQKYRRHDP